MARTDERNDFSRQPGQNSLVAGRQNRNPSTSKNVGSNSILKDKQFNLAPRIGWRALPEGESNFAFSNWRRGWDSNPRSPHGDTRSPGVPVRPLQHLSATDNIVSRNAEDTTYAASRHQFWVVCVCFLSQLAERVGFEPTLGNPRPLFESGTMNHSVTSPSLDCTLYVTNKRRSATNLRQIQFWRTLSLYLGAKISSKRFCAAAS